MVGLPAGQTLAFGVLQFRGYYIRVKAAPGVGVGGRVSL